MNFKDRLSGAIPDELKTPRQPASLVAFKEALRVEGAKKVTAAPSMTPIERRTQGYSGVSATKWMYHVAFTAVGRQGRRIVYDFPCTEKASLDDTVNKFGGRAVGTRVASDLESLWLLTTYVTADKLLADIKEQMPQCETVLMDDGKPFTKDQYEQLHSNAQTGHIRSWDQE
jgi:hypothetical protein